jgi:hypothetical protein
MNLRYALPFLLAGCSSGSTPAVASGSDASSSPMDSSSSDAASQGDDAATDSAAPTADDASDAGPVCNTIANGAPVVDVVQIAADPPTPQGGTIADGTYWATSVSIYTGPSGPTGKTGTLQATAVIQGDTVQMVSSGQPMRRTIRLTAVDGGFTSVDTCPESQMSQGGYTATPTTLTIFLPGGTDDAGLRTVVETLTRQ